MDKAFKGMRGAYAALFTPYDKKGKVNPEAIEEVIEYGLKNGLNGFYLTGSTGEWWLLSKEERKLVYNTAVKAINGRGKLIAHVGANSTDEAVWCAKAAADAGIDWLSSLGPLLYRTSFDAAVYHYTQIAKATDLPFMVYSIFSDLKPERDIKLFDLPNVKGMKYTGRDYYAAKELKRDLDAKGKETLWFAGCDEQLTCALALGKDMFAGGIGTTYNIIPKHFAGICAAAEKGDFKTAAKLQDEANKVVRLMIESDNWSYRKDMMRYIGIDVGFCRAPFEPISAAAEKAFLKRFDALKVAKKNQAKAK